MKDLSINEMQKLSREFLNIEDKESFYEVIRRRDDRISKGKVRKCGGCTKVIRIKGNKSGLCSMCKIKKDKEDPEYKEKIRK